MPTFVKSESRVTIELIPKFFIKTRVVASVSDNLCSENFAACTKASVCTCSSAQNCMRFLVSILSEMKLVNLLTTEGLVV